MRSATEQLAAVDEANLVLDHVGQVNVFLIAGLFEPGGFVRTDGTPDIATMRAVLADRIAALPSLCRVPVPVGRSHHWVEAKPDLERHIRLIGPFDGIDGIERTCGQLMTVPLPLDRPLWELLIGPDSRTGNVVFVLRIHHAIADGMAALAIAHALFERAATVDRLAVSTPPASDPTMTPASITTHGKHPLRMMRRAIFSVGRILKTVFGRGVNTTVLLGDRGPRRGVVFVDTDLRALKTRVRPFGMTVNDALLSATTAGYIAMLQAAGEPIPSVLPVSTPVALGRRGSSGNQVGVMIVRLPLAEPDPDARLRLVADQTHLEKQRARDQGTLEFMRGPTGARIMDRIGRRQRLVAGFVTNVPGPASRMFLAGAPVTAVWPLAVLAGNVRLGVAASSYAGRLWCSIHFDEASLPGVVFAQAMKEEFVRLTT
ncbi:WS/DGAT domain-containing protein [Mycetocola miduiensis]|uniref:diacylglycerol O-acyltransferase n=1 Tax=Mycetocola miduiensis TaxID=995034 RepID=A0A1I4ZYF6_9MICO|nr:WS/DGAT domain-containing protein [Mycetocola miduiensis]SFN55232.1 acyltransferase, WS/DGAT/MGAT [Mycetocola miduiensis]